MIDYSRQPAVKRRVVTGIVTRGLRSFLWLLAGAGLIGAVTFIWTAPLTTPVYAVVVGVLAALVLAMMSGPLALYRRRRALALVGHVGSAIGLRLPLPRYLRTIAPGESRGTRVRLLRIAECLEQGLPIYEAMRCEIAELSPLDRSRIAAAEASLRLEATSRHLLQAEQRRTQSAPPGEGGLAYLSIVGFAMVTAAAMLVIFVFPKFNKILSDFHVPQPAAMRLLSHLGDAVVLQLIAIVLLLMCVHTIAASARGLIKSTLEPSLYRYAFDPILWYAPVAGRVIRARTHAAVCEAFAGAIAGGRATPEAISIANLPAMNVVLRRRMNDWYARVVAGEPLAAAAAAARMPRLLTDLLAGAKQDVAAAASFAARAYAAVSERHLLIVRAVTPLLLVGIFAAGVVLLALAMFEPMIDIANHLAIWRVR